jgi:predicted Zn-ribbon and HTH transcriptional regulator
MKVKLQKLKCKLQKLKCGKCGYEWTPRKEDVRQCPKCKTAYWDKKEAK